MREQHYLQNLMCKRTEHTQVLLDVLAEQLAEEPNGK